MYSIMKPCRSISSSIIQYNPSTSRMFRQICRHIENLIINNNPTILLRIMLSNFLFSKFRHKPKKIRTKIFNENQQIMKQHFIVKLFSILTVQIFLYIAKIGYFLYFNLYFDNLLAKLMQKFNRQSTFNHNIENGSQNQGTNTRSSLSKAIYNRQQMLNKKNYHLMQPFTTKLEQNCENLEGNISLSEIAPQQNFECFHGKFAFYNDHMDIIDRSKEQIDAIQQDCTQLQLLHEMCNNMKKLRFQSPSKVINIKNTQEIDVQKINSTITGILEKLALLQSENLHVKIKMQEELIKNRQFSKQAEKQLKDILIKVMKRVYVKSEELNQTITENQNLKRQITKLTQQLTQAKSKISQLQQKIIDEYSSQRAQYNKTPCDDQEDNFMKVSQAYCIQKVKRSASRHLLNNIHLFPVKKNIEGQSEYAKQTLDSLNNKFDRDSNKTWQAVSKDTSKEKQDILSIERTDVQQYSRRGQLCHKTNNRLKRKQTIPIPMNQSQKIIINQQKRQKLKRFIAQRPSIPQQKVDNQIHRYSMNMKTNQQQRKKAISKQNPISHSASSLVACQKKDYAV